MLNPLRSASLARLLLLPAGLLLLLLASPASADDSQLLSYSLKPAVEEGAGYPQVYLDASSDFRKVDLICQRGDGQEIKLNKGATKRGQKITFDLEQPAGTFTYSCEARGFYGTSDDEFFDLSFRFDAFLGGALSIEVPRDKLVLDAGTLIARADRTISAAHIRAVTPEGPKFDADVDVHDNAAGDDLYLSWDAVSGTVLQLDVTLTDRWGFYSFENIYPWSLEIEHEDIHFDTGSHDIKDDQRGKLDQAWTEINTVAGQYGQYVEVRLYIAGYTDTVGDKASNQGLSERRARSIAQAFAKKGFSGPVYYQGFGEDGQAVGTGDGVDEIGNRRAVYALASRHPDPSHNFPKANWKRLP